MSNLTIFPDLSLAREQAAAWIAKLDRGLTAAEQIEMRSWSASPANARALQEMSALWDDLGVIKSLAEVFPSQGPAAPPAARQHAPAVSLQSVSAARPRTLWKGAAAAGVLALVATSLWLYSRTADHQANPVAAQVAQAVVYETAVGGQRSVALDDGSVLSLNTGSSVAVEMHADSRELRLLRGEVHFTVAHDASRPFRVSAGGRIVQAVGTAFDVRLHPEAKLEVIVTEGRVRVSQGAAGGDAAIAERLDRGQSLVVDASGRALVENLDSDKLTSRLAWRNGMLVFDGDTLQSALDEFSRYTTDRLTIVDDDLRDLRIGGYFPTGDTDALVEALRTSFGLRISQAPDGTLQIRRGTRAAARPAGN